MQTTNYDQLVKELHRLQRQLNSPRLNVYILGDNSPEQQEKDREREVKKSRFYEVLGILRKQFPSNNF